MQTFACKCNKCPRAFAGRFANYQEFIDTVYSLGWRVYVKRQEWLCPECGK